MRPKAAPPLARLLSSDSSYVVLSSSSHGRRGSGRPMSCAAAAIALTTRAASGSPSELAARPSSTGPQPSRSEEHTSELQSRENLVCRLLLEKQHSDRFLATE